MNVLEKILEGIEHEAMTNKEIGRHQCEGMARAMNIIRSHMDEIPAAPPEFLDDCKETAEKYNVGMSEEKEL